MPGVRGHTPFVIEEINGLWSRGADETCPSDHLLVANNIQFVHSGIETRQAVKPYVQQSFSGDLRQAVRVYNYNAQWGQSLIVMTEGGIFWHVLSATEVYQILTVPTATDFAMIVINGRAYISPFKSFQTTPGLDQTPQTYVLGCPGECVYVYGSNTRPNIQQGIINARPAAGSPPTNASRKPFMAYVSSFEGTVDKGFHGFLITFNTDGIAGPEAPAIVDAPGGKAIELLNIPIGPAGITSRTMYMSKAATTTPLAPATTEYFFLATIPDNTTTTFRVSIPDAGLGAKYVAGTNLAPVSSAMIVEQATRDGFCDLGFHLLAVVYETDSGYMTALGPELFSGQTFTNGKKSVKISKIPTSPASFVKKRHIVSTKWIPNYNGDQKGYQFFFVPKGTLENNSATEITVDYYDSDLLSDASHLIDNFSRIPAGVNFCQYHSRMVLVGDSSYPKKLDGTTEDVTKGDNRSVAWVSAPGEPEAFNQIDGIIVTPRDGTPLTNCQDFRDVLYLYKTTRTYAYVDNEDEPVTWKEEVLDQGIGASVHGIAEVLDSGGVNVDFLIVCDWSGLMLFNGTYARPELSWKIENIWIGMDKNLFHKLQIVNDSIHKKLWILRPIDHFITDAYVPGIIYLADYGNGLDPKNIRWAVWQFEGANITSLTLSRTDKMVMSTWQPDDPFNPA